MKKIKAIPVMQRMCPTCPFHNAGYTQVRPLLETRAKSCSPICHSTGDSDVTPANNKIHKEPHVCRGARDIQLSFFHSIRFIDEPTDEAWDRKLKEMNNERKQGRTRH